MYLFYIKVVFKILIFNVYALKVFIFFFFTFHFYTIICIYTFSLLKIFLKYRKFSIFMKRSSFSIPTYFKCFDDFFDIINGGQLWNRWYYFFFSDQILITPDWLDSFFWSRSLTSFRSFINNILECKLGYINSKKIVIF